VAASRVGCAAVPAGLVAAATESETKQLKIGAARLTSQHSPTSSFLLSFFQACREENKVR
jgi:hypothetical protein